MQSIRKIMKDINFKMPEEIICEGSAKFMHNIIQNENPEEIINMIHFPRSRNCVDLTLQFNPKTERLRRNAIYAGITNFNRIPSHLKGLSAKKMKIQLKKTKLDPKKMK